MKNLTYSITREDAAKILWVSTRTLDRKIVKWIFSYKKIANRIYLAQEEVDVYKNQMEIIHSSTPQSVIMSENTVLANLDKDLSQIWEIKDMISNNFNKFFALIREKDSQLNEKNGAIFSLQAKILELESELKAYKSLPDYSKKMSELEEMNSKLQSQIKTSVPLNVYNQEKQQLISEHTKLEEELVKIEEELNREKENLLMYNEKKDIENENLRIILRKERYKNLVFIVMIVMIVLVMFFVFVNR